EQLAGTVILVGDPGRVDKVASLLDKKEFRIQNREFVSVTGSLKGKRLSVISTGIGTDNIDIVLNELDALANIDFNSREIHKKHRGLNLVRIGTCGSLQEELHLHDFVISRKVIGLDGLLNFYAGRSRVTDLNFEKQFRKELNWNPLLASPYVAGCSPVLLQRIGGNPFKEGITVSAPGFYGPQGRILRLDIADPDINRKLSDFSYDGYKITNYEMECSAIYGLAALLGHQALTVCLVIADRRNRKADSGYRSKMHELINLILNKLTR
ncbi:MAG: nucleoside phosphorylase, partial [Mangrovibacterium sp.]